MAQPDGGADDMEPLCANAGNNRQMRRSKTGFDLWHGRRKADGWLPFMAALHRTLGGFVSARPFRRFGPCQASLGAISKPTPFKPFERSP